MLGMNSDRVRKDCFKVGNALTFKEAHEMTKSEESADKQLQLVNTEVAILFIPQEGTKVKEISDELRPLAQVNHRLAETVAGVPIPKKCPARNATCHYCHKEGHLVKACPSKLKTKDVHGIKATSDGTNESILDPSQIPRNHMFMGPISAT